MMMNSRIALVTITYSRALCRGALAMLVASAVASPAVATPIHVQARQDHSVVSSFALDFGPQGGVASALISRTDLELEIDGLAGTARFLNYDQDIDALTLPGNLSTGAIRVQIVPDSSTGTYNRATGEFVTNELYNIEFDGDLSAYGLFSPVILPSQSVGVVDVVNTTVGNVIMNWAGSNINNPMIPLDFSYICSVFATFSVTPVSFIDAEIIPLVEQMFQLNQMPQGLRDTLVFYLTSAVTALNADTENDDDRFIRIGVGYLRSFNGKVRRSVPTHISADNASILIGKANEVISVILYPMAQPMGLQPAPLDTSNPSISAGKGSTRISK